MHSSRLAGCFRSMRRQSLLTVWEFVCFVKDRTGEVSPHHVVSDSYLFGAVDALDSGFCLCSSYAVPSVLHPDHPWEGVGGLLDLCSG